MRKILEKKNFGEKISNEEQLGEDLERKKGEEEIQRMNFRKRRVPQPFLIPKKVTK